MPKKINELVEILTKNCEQVLPREDFVKKIESGKKLKIKLGMDPTAPDLHLGHAVVLKKMREFQDLGHEIIFIIGSFTAMIGDPSGKSKTRPPLTAEEIEKNAQTYAEQVGKILDPNKMSVRYNSDWFGKLNVSDFIKIAGHVTLARIIEREDFKKRLQENSAIGLHELFYPIIQGYDSVHLNADVELGGSDQTFNLLMGRFLQEQYNQEPQVIMTVPLLEGLDGVRKMSKSYGNYVGLLEDPKDAFGKLMSISDQLMWRYYKLLLDVTDEEIKEMQVGVASEKLHPMELKKNMAEAIIKRFWSEEEAKVGRIHFESIFQKKDYSLAKEVKLPKDFAKSAWIVDLLKALEAIKTTSEAKRLIEDGAVKIDEENIKDFKAEIRWQKGMIIKVGKHRIYKLA